MATQPQRTWSAFADDQLAVVRTARSMFPLADAA
jgi:hypothetical protein